jgi:hypothetical protein
MEKSLSKSLDFVRIQKSIHGIKIIRGNKRINHSQFADDTLLISVTSTILALRFKRILDMFTKPSRGPVNNAKSQLYTWNISPNLSRAIDIIFNSQYNEKWQSLKYPGIPISLETMPSSSCQPILDKFKSKFNHWGSLWLNPIGRIVLHIKIPHFDNIPLSLS